MPTSLQDSSQGSDGGGKNATDAASSPLSSPLLQDDINRKERRQRATLIVFASCSIFLFAGSFYGWGPMQLLLEENGNFLPDTCLENAQGEDCPEQTAALLNCRFVSQLTVLTGPLLGFMSDRYGGTSLTYCFGISTTAGLALLMLAAEFPGTVWDNVLYGAFILMGLAATSGGLLTVETGVLFRDPNASNGTSKAQSRVISLLNSLFDAGAMTYLGLWGIEKVTSHQDQNDMNLLPILGGYLGIGLLSLGCYAWFFRQVVRQGLAETGAVTADVVSGNHTKKRMTEHTLQSQLTSAASFQVKESMDATVDAEHVDPESTDIVGHHVSMQSPLFDTEKEHFNELHPTDPEDTTAARQCLYTPISQRSVSQQLRCQAYLLLCTLFSFHMVSNVWTLTTARDFLKYLGDDDYGNRYLSIFTLMTPVSLVALPFVDVAIHKYGFAWALQGVNFLGLVHGIIKVSSTSLNIQIIGFVVFSFFRCFLFAVTFSCLASFTSADATGRAVGVMYVISGVASFVNIGLANLAVEKMNGDFFVPNLLFLVLTVPMIYVTFVLGKALMRDDRGRNTPEAQLLMTIANDKNGNGGCVSKCLNVSDEQIEN